MASSQDFIEFVCEQIHNNFNIRYRKMFGDYMVYANDKPIFLVCDNTVYVKKLKEVESLMENSDVGVPYNGAKEHYILDIENNDLVFDVANILERITPIPKKKIKK